MTRLTLNLMMAALLCSSGLLCAAEQVGVSFDQSRFIFPADRAAIGVTVANNTDDVFLAQAWVRALDVSSGKANDAVGRQPFLIAPPLYRLDARQSQTFRLLGQPTALASLPKDRESAFYVSVKMLPEKANGKESGGTGGVDMSLSMVLVNNAKLFYRPAGLKPASVGEASEQLHFQRAGGRLVAENPTPYYMSFATLKVNGVSVSDADRFRMTPPRGKAEYALPVGKSGATVVEWQVLDENGRATTLRRQPLE